MTSKITQESFYLPNWLKEYAKKVAGKIILSENQGKTIKKYREKTGLTQKELSEIINIARETISRIENNRSNPNCEFIRKITEITTLSEAIRNSIAKIDVSKSKTEKNRLGIPYLMRIASELELNKEEFEKIILSSLDSYQKRKKDILEDLEGLNEFN